MLIILCLGAGIQICLTNLWCSMVHRRLGRHQSVLVFVFSSVVAFVGNSSIRGAIFIQCLGCLNIDKLVYTLSTSRPVRSSYWNFMHARSFSVITVNAVGVQFADHAYGPQPTSTGPCSFSCTGKMLHLPFSFHSFNAK